MNQIAVIYQLSSLIISEKNIELEEWLKIYKFNHDIYIHHLLLKILPKIFQFNLFNLKLLIDLNSHCLVNHCELLFLAVKFNPTCSKEINKWITNQTLDVCEAHCFCSLVKLLQVLISNDQKLSTKLILNVNGLILNQSKRCTLNQYLDLVLSILSSSLLSLKMFNILTEKVLSDETLILKALKEPFDSFDSKIYFNATSSLIIFRKYVLIRLKLTSLQKSAKVDEIKHQLTLIKKLLFDFNFKSLDPFVEILFDDDVKLLTGFIYLFEIYFMIDEHMVHSSMNSLLKSINYDESLLLDWMISDPDTSSLLLQLLVIYLKNVNSMLIIKETKVTLNKLFEKLLVSWKKKLIPFNPQPLLKFVDRLK